MKKRIIIYIIAALLIIGAGGTAYYFYQTNKQNQTQQEEIKPAVVKEITYKGKDGVTALTIFEQKAKITTSGTGESAFVTSVNGVAANAKSEFWAFNVNGKLAPVGVGSYVTKSSDTIALKLSSF